MKTLLTIAIVLNATLAFSQVGVLTPSGNYLCLPGSVTTICSGSDGGATILQLGPQTYAVTPMTPTMPTYPSLDEPKQPRESSTPLFFGASEGKPDSLLEHDSPKTPCYSLFRDC